ncbi:MAG: hypothetical protein LUQ50_11965, partial [Methanospirillum sp.]|uniref:hypothetical protein n=1 Tax=Methanospirillum sp. TaxID=45200 RepID=UPI00236C2FD7
AESTDPSYIYGKTPTGGKSALKITNNDESVDMVAVLTKGGDKTPIFAIYIPSKTTSSIPNMVTGMFNLYYMTGVDWNEQKHEFNDAVFYKVASPLIVGENSEYLVQLYANSGNTGGRIKKIEEGVFPKISGTSES